MSRTMAADGEYFLDQDVKMELLTHRWYAWPHLVAPVQHAMNIAFRHVPVLQSFLSHPAVHAKAVKDPKMLGAPFVDVPVEQAQEVHELLENTKKQAGHLVDFAHSFRNFNGNLLETATGFSLDGEYGNLPAALSGLVELVYDSNSKPKIRIREELAYREKELDDTAGQEICMSRVRDIDRKFFLTTPRLRRPDALNLDIRFSDPRLDTLASLRIRGCSKSELGARMQLSMEQMTRLESFLTENPPERLQPQYQGTGVRLRYFGHACVLVQTAESSILVDPLTAWERQGQGLSLTFSDLPDRIDYAVLSHCHMDHCCPEMIVQLRQRVGQWIVPRNNAGDIADPSMKLILERLGCRNVISVDPFDQIRLGDGAITSLPFPGEHCGLDISSKHSILIALRDRKFLFLVDSDAVDTPLYTRLARRIGRVDAIFIGMECYGAPLSWFYGPLLGKVMSRRDDESRRGNASNCARAWDAIRDIECRDVYVYAMGNESWNRYLLGLEYSEDSVQLKEATKFVDVCRAAGKRAERLDGCREFYF